MVEFNKLSEGEKFAFAKDFLVKFRVIQKLRPELTAEKDILVLVAKKFYGENLEQLEDCINFIESKVKLSSLSNVNLEPAVREYEESIKQKLSEVESKVKKEAEDEDNKRIAYEKETKLRNFYDGKYNREKLRQRRGEKIKNIIILTIVALALFGVLGAGGIVGFGNQILSWISNLSSFQVMTLGGAIWLGYKQGWFKNAKGKYDGWRKGRKDKRDKMLSAFKEEQDKHVKEQKKIADDRAKIHTERMEDIKAADMLKHELESESVHIGRYSRMNNFDKALKLSEIEIKDQYEKALRQYDSDEEKKNLEKWYEHFVGALYFGAYKGALKDRADIENMVNESRLKFEQLSNPLNVGNTFSEQNVRAQNHSGANKTLDEMYLSI